MLLGGTISYEDAVKQNPGDQFSTSRKVRVELNFAVPEDPGIDPDSVLSEVMEKAIALTNEKLGIKTATRNAKSNTITVTPGATAVTIPVTKADLEKEATEKAEGKKRGPGRPKATPAEKPAEDWDTGNASPTSATDVASQSSAPAESASDEWEVPAQTEITDAELHKAVQGKAEKTDVVKIRQLIASFNPDPKKPFKIAMIDQTQRQTFLDKLKDLV